MEICSSYTLSHLVQKPQSSDLFVGKAVPGPSADRPKAKRRDCNKVNWTKGRRSNFWLPSSWKFTESPCDWLSVSEVSEPVLFYVYTVIYLPGVLNIAPIVPRRPGAWSVLSSRTHYLPSAGRWWRCIWDRWRTDWLTAGNMWLKMND
jgi:hypothetical protein